MLNKNYTVQMYVIAIIIAGAIFVNPISGLSEKIQLVPVDNAYLDQLAINSAQEKANPAQVEANLVKEQANSVPDQVKPIEEQANSKTEEVTLVEEQATSNPKEVILVEKPANSNPEEVTLVEEQANSNPKEVKLVEEPANSNLEEDKLVEEPANSNLEEVKLIEEPANSNPKEVKLVEEQANSNPEEVTLVEEQANSNQKEDKLVEEPANSNLEKDKLIEEPANSNLEEDKLIKDQANSNSKEVKQIEYEANSKPGEVKLIEEQAISKPDQVNSELEDIFSMSLDAKPRAFDLSNDEAVNNQATVIEDDAIYLYLNKDSIDKQTNLDNENEIPFLQEDGSVDITNLNYVDYMYLMDNKENSIVGENSNINGQGIDNMFYMKPLGLYPNTQRLTVESLNDFFDDKVIIGINAIDYGQYIQPVNDVARIRIITFFEETPDTFEQNQGLPNIDYPKNFEFPSNEVEQQFSATKSRISLYVFGWMFMVTGIALSCFIVIVGRKAANKRTIKVKKFTATGEQQYHKLGSEV